MSFKKNDDDDAEEEEEDDDDPHAYNKYVLLGHMLRRTVIINFDHIRCMEDITNVLGIIKAFVVKITSGILFNNSGRKVQIGEINDLE